MSKTSEPERIVGTARLYSELFCETCGRPFAIHGINCPGITGLACTKADELEAKILSRVEEILLGQNAELRSRQVRALIRAAAEVIAEEKAQ